MNNFSNLISKYGKGYTLSRPVLGDYIDPSHPSMGREELPPEEYPFKGKRDNYSSDMISASGGLIKFTDVKLYMSVEGITITPGSADKVIDGSETYNIENIDTYDISGEIIYYELQLRN